MSVTVVVATYGSTRWAAWGNLAAVNAEKVTGVPVVRVHSPRLSLAGVRNEGLRQVQTERVCFLDGDDGLEPGYFDRDLPADITVTPLDGVFPTVNRHSHQCEPGCLVSGNYIHVGAIASTETIRRLGGFRDLPIYEDWDLWLRCYYAGATFESSPGPSYLTRRQGAGGRNTALSIAARKSIRSRILANAQRNRSMT